MKITLPDIKAVVFDLDDTLFSERAYAFSGFTAVGRWLRNKVAFPFDPARRMRELFIAGERRRIFDQLLAEVGCEQAQALVPEMVACYRTHLPHITLFDDAHAALRAWRGRCRLGLISDGPLVMQQLKVEALSLPQLIDVIILTDELGPPYWKPHTRAFELMQTRLGVSGPAAVYIADNRGKDFVAPRKLGWRTVWLQRPAAVYGDVPAPPGGEPHYAIGSLADLDLSD